MNRLSLCQRSASQIGSFSMAQQALRNTYKFKPTLQQDRTLAFVLRRCHELYNVGLQERKAAREKRRVSVTEAMQSANCQKSKKYDQRTMTSTRRSCGCIDPARQGLSGVLPSSP